MAISLSPKAALVTPGNIVNWIGDSISPPLTGATHSLNGSGSGNDFLWWAHLLSQGQLLYGKPAGVGGERADQMLARIDTDALSEGGHWCGIQTGTNDASGGRTPAQFAADIRGMCAAIEMRGMRPILATCVPQPSAYRQAANKYSSFLASYANAQGYPLIDFFNLLADPAGGGGYLAAYDNGDGIHPSPAGKKVMGQAISDAMTKILRPYAPPLPTTNLSTNSANLVTNGMFLLDSNADGYPDSWTAKNPSGSTFVFSLVTGDSAIRGTAFRMVDTLTSGFTQAEYLIGSASSYAGKRVAFTGRFKNSGATSASLTLTTNGAVPVILKAIASMTTVTGWQTFYCEGVMPADLTTLRVLFSSSGGATLDCQIAQIGVYDLTAAGI